MKKVNNGHRWTNDELLKLIGDWVSGIDIDEIAKSFQCTRFGINKQILRLRQDGISVPRRTSGHKAGRHNKPWTQAEIEYLVRRRNDKATAEQIATELDRSFFAVQAMIQTLRKEKIPVKMLGMGVRRLWNPEVLKVSIAGRNLIPAEN